MDYKVISFGAIVWDIIGEEEYIGGATLNLVAHMTKLGCGTAMITRIGEDLRGHKAVEEIKRLGVEDSFVQHDSIHPTATAQVVLHDDGIPQFEVSENAAFDYISIDKTIMNQIKGWKPDAICYGTIEQRSEVTRKALYKLLQEVQAKHLFFDVNIRMGFCPVEIIKQGLKFCTIVKLNDDEVKQISYLLYGEQLGEDEFVLRLFNDYEVSVVCITRGKDGCVAYDKNGKRVIEGLPVNVEDTVGAGDAFSAAFLYTYMKTQDVLESARRGNILGAFVASQKGAIPDYSHQIKKTMGEQSKSL